jgi:hypothetical protein
VPYDLRKWVSLYRPASTPAPAPTSDAAAPPERPSARRPIDPVSLLPVWLRQALPRTSVLTDVVLPLGVFTGFALLFAAGIAGTVRAARRAQRR